MDIEEIYELEKDKEEENFEDFDNRYLFIAFLIVLLEI